MMTTIRPRVLIFEQTVLEIRRKDRIIEELVRYLCEKSPASLCRKIAEATNPGTIMIWGDGKQT